MNKVILCGRLTAKPILRHTDSNKQYCRFTIAVNKPVINQDGTREADFINCIAWNKTGETITKYFDRGKQILINGKIQTNKYTDKDGNNRYTTDILVEEFEFLGNKQDIKPDVNIALLTKEPKDEPKDEPKEDPFADFGDTVSIDDDYLE